jgi:hypothetical protein
MRSRLLFIVCLFLLCTYLTSPLAFAQDNEAAHSVYVPPSLAEWREWVLYEQAHLFCPQQQQSHNDSGQKKPHLCTWPKALMVQAFDDHAVFESHWYSYSESEIPLPGNDEYWPTQVFIDGEAAVVTPNAQNLPSIRVQAGEHEIRGRFDWNQLPDYLAIPRESTLVTLSINGKPVVPLNREYANELYLSSGRTPQQQEDQIQLVVGRVIQDGFPLTMQVHIELFVYGQSREERIGPIALPGFEVVSVESKLPTSINDDGSMQVQLQAGEHKIIALLRAVEPLESLHKPTLPEPWPAEEVWSFAPDAQLRTIRIESATLADRSQVQLPIDFPYDHSLYLMGNQDQMQLVELSRGQGKVSNELTIQRNAWLSFNGDQLINQDTILGTMRTGWRFNVSQPFHLKQVVDNDLYYDKHKLITQQSNSEGPSTPQEGIEWRSSQVNISATARTDFQSALPLSAWQQTIQSIETRLQLPPGYRLLHASGYDRIHNSWLSRWNIFSVFLLILTTTVVYRLFSWPQAIAAFLLLSLGMHEPYIPKLLTLLSALLLLINSWFTQSRFKSFIHKVTTLAVVLLSIQLFFFSLNQIQTALYPDLENQSVAFNLGTLKKQLDRENKFAAVELESEAILDEIMVTGSRVSSPAQEIISNDPDAHTQAGLGVPEWSWNQYILYRNGPITNDEQQQLFILYPWQSFVIHCLLVLLGGYLLLCFARLIFGRGNTANSVVPASLFLMISLSLFTPHWALAQESYPSEQQLAELQQRLLSTTHCQAVCTSLSNVTLSDNEVGNLINLSGDIHSKDSTTFLLPSYNNEQPWAIREITINDQAIPVYHHDGDYLIPVSPGINRLSMVVDSQGYRQLSFTFASQQAYFETKLQHWQSSGLFNHRLNNNTLTLSRLSTQTTNPGESKASYQAKPLIEVERILSLDLEPRFEIRVEHAFSSATATHVELPLLDNEMFLTSYNDAQHQDNKVSFTLESGDQHRLFTRLPLLQHYEWQANTNPDIAERWSILVSPLLNVRINGTPLLAPTGGFGSGYIYFYYKPRSGEHISIEVSRPKAVPGNTIAIQNAHHELSVGRRLSESRLDMDLTVTNSGVYQIPFPDHAELLSVSLNDDELPVQVIDGVIELPVNQSTQSISLNWRQAIDKNWHLKTPALDLQQPMANITTVINAPEERWLLWVYGDGIGPALRFWSLLAFMVLVAFALSRVPASPLAFHQWLLLGFGFSAVHSWWFVWIVGFFFILAKRRSNPPNFEHKWRSRAIQSGFTLLSIITFILLLNTVVSGLLSQPDMHIANPLSRYAPLHWYQDMSSGTLPVSGVISVPMWFYRVAMLLWALWFSLQFVQWLRWTWGSLNAGGFWPEAKRTSQKAPTAATENPEHNE